MKTMTKLLLTTTIVCAFFVPKTIAQKLETGSFKALPESTIIKWKGVKITGEHTGIIKLKSGTINLKDGKITNGFFEIDMNTIENTDMEGEWKEKLEGHLKSEDFFHTEKYPVSKFEITSVKSTDDKTCNITGKLTIKEITNNISFPATVEVTKNKITTDAEITIDRTMWDIRYGSGKFFEGLGDKMIYDDITFKLKITAVK